MDWFPNYFYAFYLEFLVFQEEDMAAKQLFQVFMLGLESGWPRLLASHDLIMTVFSTSMPLNMACHICQRFWQRAFDVQNTTLQFGR